MLEVHQKLQNAMDKAIILIVLIELPWHLDIDFKIGLNDDGAIQKFLIPIFFFECKIIEELTNNKIILMYPFDQSNHLKFPNNFLLLLIHGISFSRLHQRQA